MVPESPPMDAALVQAEREVLDQLKKQRYLDLLVHKFEAGQAAPAPVQQPGHSGAAERRQPSAREMHLRQQINSALNTFTRGATQNAQQWHLRAYQPFQWYPNVEHSSKSSAQARVDMNSSSAGISEGSDSIKPPVGFVRPWSGKSKWPEPYTACQDALQKRKNRQLEGEPKTGSPRDAVEQNLDEYRAASNAHLRHTMDSQDHALVREVSLPEPNRNIAQSDISDYAPVRHINVSGRNWNIMAQSDVSGQAPAQREVSVPQQSQNFVAWSGVPGGTRRERSTAIWHPPIAVPRLPADADIFKWPSCRESCCQFY
ncbi:hypothetical protein MTO96_017785 [Rhipicephalus appendiculatus]